MEKTIDSLNTNLQEDSTIVTTLVGNVITEYSADLDSLMKDLNVAVTQPEAISTDLIERYYAELTTLVYFMCERIEKLNVLSDLSKAKLKEAYNSLYIKVCGEKDERGKSIRTINENTALAEDGSKYEATLNIVYDQAYRTLKMKVDMAMEMVSTLKHILKRRAQEEYMNFSVSSMKYKGDN